jgi:hypothetical protein
MGKLNYRLCRDINHITKKLLEIELSSSDITLWQNHDQNTKYIPLGPISWKIDVKKNVIVINVPEEIGTGLNLKSNKDLYIHSHQQSIVFKSNQFKYNESQILIHIPKVVHLIEKRQSMRFRIAGHQNTLALFKKDSAYSAAQRNDKLFSLSCLDVSECGLALKVKISQLTKYTVGNHLSIREIAGIKLNPINAEILYTKPLEIKGNGQKFFKLGLRLGDKLTREEIARILLNSNLNQDITA